MKTLWVNAFVGRVNTFAKELIHVSRTGKVYVDDKWVIRIRTTFVHRIRLALAYRQQRRVQLDAAWRKATTLPADGPKAAAVFEALRGNSEPPFFRNSKPAAEIEKQYGLPAGTLAREGRK